MPTRVQLPDGSIGEFPDGMSESQIEGVLQKQYGGPQTSSRPAGLPAGMDLPQLPAHPAVNMRGGAGNLETIPSSEAEPGLLGAIKTGVHNFGARVANNGIALVKPLEHPIDSMLSHPGFANPSDMGGPIQTIINSPDKGVGVANALGDTATALLTAKGMEGAAKLAPKIVPAIGRAGSALQDAGAGVINSKFAPTMKEVIRGNNPGRGILESGIGTTLSKASLANKINGATEAVGSRIGDAVERADENELAPRILSSDIASSITNPINQALGKINGPFGTASTAPYETMSAKLGNTAPGAKAPIFGPDAPSEILPSDLWKHIQNLDQNTRFNTDPEVESVNETRRDIRQGLRPSLEAAAPTIRPLSRTYSDLLSADNAVSRSQGGFSVPKGIASLADATIKSTPVVTGAASRLFKIGGGLKSFAMNAPEWMGGHGGSSPTIGFQQKPQNASSIGPENDRPSVLRGLIDPDYSEGGFPARPSVVTPVPSSPLRLPAIASEGELQPMVWPKANPYPDLAEDFSRTRIVPSRSKIPSTTLPSETKGLMLGAGERLGLPADVGEQTVDPRFLQKQSYPSLNKGTTIEKSPVFFPPKSPGMLNGLFTVGEDGQIMPQRKGLPEPKPKSRKGNK